MARTNNTNWGAVKDSYHAALIQHSELVIPHLFQGLDSRSYVVHRPIELLLSIRTHLHYHATVM